MSVVGYIRYNGPVYPQTVGAIVLTETELNSETVVYVINTGPDVTVTTLGALADFIIVKELVYIPDIAATGNSQDTALSLPGQGVIFSVVAPGAGGKIPTDAGIGSSWDVWNTSSNGVLIYPMKNARIESGSTNAPVSVPSGGRTTFVVSSSGQIFAR